MPNNDSLAVIVPSRGRPESVGQLVAAFAKTCTGDTELVLAVDDDDPALVDYQSAVAEASGDAPRRCTLAAVPDSTSMVYALNWTAGSLLNRETVPFAVGFMGDDHRPRTVGWDATYVSELRGLGSGIVYGDDLFQGRRLPTQCAMTSDIVEALGFMSPPVLTHMYVDNFWLALGNAAKCVRFLPDVIVEHVHPAAGKSGWDEGYVRVNHPEMYAKDERAYREYLADGFARDVEKVRALRAKNADS